MASAKLPTFLDKLDPHEQAELFTFLGSYIKSTIENDGDSDKRSSELVRSEAVGFTLGKVVEKTGRPPEEVLLFALTFYEIAIDAVKRGQRLVLVDNGYGFVSEVTGLMPTTSENVAHEKVAG